MAMQGRVKEIKLRTEETDRMYEKYYMKCIGVSIALEKLDLSTENLNIA